MKKINKELSENEQEHYVGNVFGWRVSMAGLFLILFFIAFAWYRKTYHVDPNSQQEESIDLIEYPHEK